MRVCKYAVGEQQADAGDGANMESKNGEQKWEGSNELAEEISRLVLS